MEIANPPAPEGATRTTKFERGADYVLVFTRGPSGELTIVDATEGGPARHGYTREELIGRPLTLLDPFTPREVIDEGIRNLENGMPLAFVVKHRRKDGSTFDVDVECTLVHIDGRQHIVSSERDIESIRSSEKQLRHMHDLMQYVIGHARSAIAVHDRDLKYVYVSERYLQAYNVKEQDVIGRHHYDVFPDLPQKWRDVHQRALRGEVLSAEEDSYPRADGTIEWTRWECRPWYDQDGSIGGIIVYTEVITDRVRAAQERKLLEAQLQQAMKMEAVGRLAGGVAHDFNNLLTAILGNISVMLLDAVPGDPSTELLIETAGAAERAAVLTRQLLAFSRKQVIEPRPSDLNELIRGLHKMIARLVGEDIQLQTRLTSPLLPVSVDPGQFEQVIVNLVVNARDAMPDGGKVVIETANVDLDAAYRVKHPYSKEGPHVMLALSDTGHGMTEDVKQHLFEPFFTTKGAGRGTGLGLASTFGAVKQSGGSIEVYSEVGLGTTVKIYLPASEGAAAQADRIPSTPELPTGSETLLLVEDDERVRRLAVRVLERLGYTVSSASNGAAALDQMKSLGHPVDLLVTDVVMPSMNGRELARLATEVQPGLRVLFTSGYTENIIAHHGVIDENVNFIAKPYTPFRLAQKVRDVLDS